MGRVSWGPTLLALLVILIGGLMVVISEGDPLVLSLSGFVVAIGGLLIWLSSASADHALRQRTGLMLDGLADDGFAALHDLRFGDRRLEYVLVGPPGVYVVKVDPRSDRRARRGSDQAAVADALGDLREEVAVLNESIQSQVRALLVTSQEVEVDVPNNVELVPVMRLEHFLRTQSSSWDPATTGETLANVLRAATAKTAFGDEETEDDLSSA